jgi:hypothetical protein
MKIPIIVVFTVITIVSARAQPLQGDSVDIYISKLGWASSGVAWKYFPEIALYDDAQRLITLKDNQKIQKLINNISDSPKTVVIHLILTRLLEPSYTTFAWRYIYGNDSKVKTVVYTYNGLQWATDSLFNSSVSREEINKIAQYWGKGHPEPPPLVLKIKVDSLYIPSLLPFTDGISFKKPEK